MTSFQLLFFLFIFLLIWSISQPSRVQRCVKKAIAIQNITPIFEELQKRPIELQSLFFRQSMEILWSSPKEDVRVLIQDLCLSFVQQNPRRPIGHKWIWKIQTERPDLANEELLKNYDCTYLNKREPG